MRQTRGWKIMCDNLEEDEKCLNQAKVVEPKKTEWIRAVFKNCNRMWPPRQRYFGHRVQGLELREWGSPEV